ncbi:hypothetical protein [Secundilactobacillus similis]|uniref:hypothetical protein n=1 Tax=Secundilactobacillus similis TaxID=414682 RepID=UPI0006D0CE35|nr:hypothetical protein [Secundilactobacillus similis]
MDNVNGKNTVQKQPGLLTKLIANDNFGVSIALIILVVAMALFAPNFTTVNNIFNVLLQIAQVGIVAVGMTYVILTAGIDLSVGRSSPLMVWQWP